MKRRKEYLNKMTCLTPPNQTVNTKEIMLYLMGGKINSPRDCPDWQSYVMSRLQVLDIVICDPQDSKRTNSNDIIILWFAQGTSASIGQYGKSLAHGKLFIGCHPLHEQKEVIAKLWANRKIYDRLDELVDAVIRFSKEISVIKNDPEPIKLLEKARDI